MSAETEAQLASWNGMRAPVLRKLVREKFGEVFNGSLNYAKKPEMVDLLVGDLRADTMVTRLKTRATKRQKETGLIPGRKKRDAHYGMHAPTSHKSRGINPPGRKMPSRKTTAREGRIAATDIPPGADPFDTTPANGNGHALAGTLNLAATLADIPAIRSADALTLRGAVEALISVRG